MHVWSKAMLDQHAISVTWEIRNFRLENIYAVQASLWKSGLFFPCNISSFTVEALFEVRKSWLMQI